jgi:hypothetical protein
MSARVIVSGAPIAVPGEFELRTYPPAVDETRLSWTIRADKILGTRANSKRTDSYLASSTQRSGSHKSSVDRNRGASDVARLL